MIAKIIAPSLFSISLFYTSFLLERFVSLPLLRAVADMLLCRNLRISMHFFQTSALGQDFPAVLAIHGVKGFCQIDEGHIKWLFFLFALVLLLSYLLVLSSLNLLQSPFPKTFFCPVSLLKKNTMIRF